jgi:predicted dehydrogenase
MIEVCKQAGVQLFVSYMHRYLPEVQAAKKYIEEGYIGKIEMARMRNAPGSTSTLSKWFYDKELVGGGAVLDIGVHGIDIIRMLIGDIDEVLYSKVDTLKEKVILKDEVIIPTNEDHAIAIYKTINNCLVNHEISWNHRSPVDRFSMELYGSEGSILLRGALGPLAIQSEKFGEGKEWFVPELPYSPFGATQHQAFIDMIANATQASPSGVDGLRGIEIAEEIYRVARGDVHVG